MFTIDFHKNAVKEIKKLPYSLQVETMSLISLLRTEGHQLGLPHSRAMKDGLFELRASAKDGIARSLYFFQKGKKIYVLHVFQKKTQQTPEQNLALARKRKKEVEE
ncbi:type II toxin-antitoxin system RelE/ParE family toxin [Candidatus Regiella endosymbiont of Tuberolachnus salignus]